MIIKGSSGKDAALPINLIDAATGNPITGRVFADGDVKLKTAAFLGDALGVNIHELDAVKLPGKYELWLTAAQSDISGGVVIDLKTAGTGIAGGDALPHSWQDSIGPDMPNGAVIAGILTATQFTTDLVVADANTHVDALVRFRTGALATQVKRIGAQTMSGTITLRFGYAFTRAPAIGDKFDIITR